MMEQNGALPRPIRQIVSPLQVWIVDREGRLVGPEPAPILDAVIKEVVQQVLETGEPQSREVHLPAGFPHGSRLVQVRGRSLPGAGPLPGAGVLIATFSLDSLSEAEDDLLRYDRVMRATHDGVWDWTIGTPQAWWSRQLYEMFGYAPDSIVPTYDAYMSRVHPDDRVHVEGRVRDMVATGGPILWQDEYRLQLDDGSVKVVLDRGHIERDPEGQALRMIGVISDVTAQRAATAALAESEERFRQMTSAIDQVFWLTNGSKTDVIYVSPAYETVWGRSCESLYRSPYSFLDAVHEDDRPRIETRLPLQLEHAYEEVYRIKRSDGTIAWIHDRSFPIRDGSGKVIRIAGVATDITVQRNLEQQLAQAQRMESIGRLAGGIAHDFNNLLTVILSSVQLALRSPVVGGQLETDLDSIRDAAERAARLTSQLLTFARRQVVAPARLDLNDLTRQMEQLLRRLIGEHIELTILLESELGTVVAGRSEIEQVLVNLALNARDAMPEGGQLKITTRNVVFGPRPSVGLAQVEPGNYVMLTVSDTGPGIPSDLLPHIFEPFFTTKQPGQNTGLGLATCYGVVRQAGGHIFVDTQQGKGTEFRIVLPRVEALAEPLEVRASPSLQVGSETVLFVEDDPAVRRIGVRILGQQHYRVLEAAGGEQALKVAAEHRGPIHLLVTDVVMPRMSGTELARKLLEQRPDLRVLYTSGYTEDAVLCQSMLDARSRFLHKPYVVETLLAGVRELLDRRA